MKTLTEKDVQEVAEKLISTWGDTTTLDIKNELRNQGFWAQQHDVSEKMNNLTNQGKFVFSTSIDGYRCYSKPASSTVSVSTSTTNNGWIAWSPKISETETFPASVTRDKARYDFGKKYGLSFVDTRAKSI